MDTKENRRNEIAEYINTKGSVTFQQLKDRFPGVSDMTLRTDLKELDDAKKILRVHGGARSIVEAFGNDDLLNNRLVRNIDEKQMIAAKAAQYIGQNKTIFIDSGSTTTALAKALKDVPNTYFTNGITVAMELTKLSQADVLVTGGRLNKNSASTAGNEALDMIMPVNFDLAIIGVSHFDESCGFTCESRNDFLVKKQVIAKSKTVMILMDSSKVIQPKRGTYTICTLDNIDCIISDNKLPESFLELCKISDVTVI